MPGRTATLNRESALRAIIQRIKPYAELRRYVVVILAMRFTHLLIDSVSDCN